jgi:hypothetical protein
LKLPYVDAAAVSIPCRAVGGDFFDYLRTPAPVFGFPLGDVAGKGPPAALMSAMMQGMFAYAARGQDTADPAAIVANINQALCQREVELRFVTLFFRRARARRTPLLLQCRAQPAVRDWRKRYPASRRRRARGRDPRPRDLRARRRRPRIPATWSSSSATVYRKRWAQNDEEFGDERLLGCDSARRPWRRATGRGRNPRRAVHTFTEGAVQSDDITVMHSVTTARPVQAPDQIPRGSANNWSVMRQHLTNFIDGRPVESREMAPDINPSNTADVVGEVRARVEERPGRGHRGRAAGRFRRGQRRRRRYAL